MRDRDKDIIAWFCSGDSGVSSITLCACLYGIPQKHKNANYPSDPSDFGRCKRFLDLLCPEDKETLLRAAAKLSPEWKALIGKWGDLEKLYNAHDRNMYKEMRKIITEALG